MGQYKQGLDYFPFTIGLLSDRKLRRPKLKFGYVVNDIYLSLLELIYGDRGYYLLYDEKNKDDVIWEILNNLQGKFQPTVETVEQVIEELVACELFSGDHFNTKILTSKRIQQTYYSATVERKAVDIDFDIWFLTEEEMRKLSSNSLILAKFLNRSNERSNRSNERSNRLNGWEIKEKEIKGNKSSSENLLADAEYEELCEQIGKDDCDYYIERIKAFLLKYPDAKLSVKATILKWRREDTANAPPGEAKKTYKTEDLNSTFDKLGTEEL